MIGQKAHCINLHRFDWHKSALVTVKPAKVALIKIIAPPLIATSSSSSQSKRMSDSEQDPTIEKQGKGEVAPEQMHPSDVDLEAGLEQQPLLDAKTADKRRASLLVDNQLSPDQLLATTQAELLQSARLDRHSTEVEEAAEKETFISAVIPLLALTVFLVIASYIVGRYRWSLLWVPIVGSAAFVVIKRRLQHFNLYHLNYLRREAAKIPLGTQMETTEWINHIIDRIWMVAEPIVATQVIERVNVLMREKKPSFLDSIKLTTFTLGSRAPALLGAKVYPEVSTNLIYLDLDLCFVPNDTADTTDIISARRHPARGQQWDSKIVLTVRPGRGIASFDVPILVQKITFLGKLRVQLELMPNIPFAKQVEVGFMEMPTIDFVLKPLKGLDLMDMPGLSRFIDAIIRTGLSQIAVNPNRITVNIADLLAGKMAGMEQSVGVLRIDIFAARGVEKARASLLSAFEPYVRTVVVGQIRAETRQLEGTVESLEWNETFYLLLPTTEAPIVFEVMSSATSVVGKATVPVEELASSQEPVTAWHQICNPVTGQTRGEINLGMRYYPVIDVNGGAAASEDVEKKLTAPKKKDTATKDDRSSETKESSKKEPAIPPDCRSGVLRFSIHSAKDLTKKEASIYYEVALLRNGEPPAPVTHLANYDPSAFRGAVQKRTSAPRWDQSYEMLIADPKTDVLCVNFRAKSGNVMSGLVREDHLLGSFSASVEELIGKNDWFVLMGGVEGAKMHASFTFRPIPATLELSSGTTAYIPPIGVVKLHLTSGTNLGMLDILGVGSNVFYLRVQNSSRLVGETEAYEASGVDEGLLEGKVPFARGIGGINPLKKESTSTGIVFWNETMFPIVRSEQDCLTLEVYASSTVRKQVFVGRVKAPISDLVKHPGEQVNRMLNLESAKGKETEQQLTFSLSFHPVCLQAEDGSYINIEQSSCGIVEVASIIGRDLFDSARKSTVHCQVAREVADEPPLFTEDFTANPIADGSCCWKERIETFVNTRESSNLVVQLTEQKLMTGSTVLGASRIPVQALDGEHPLAGHPTGKLFIRGEYLPVQLAIEPEPRDAGYLSVELLSASNLLPVDSGNTSDPFAVLRINDKQVHKSKKILKTLDPEWNEACRVPIIRLKRSLLQVEVRDWNRIQSSKTLGALYLDLKTAIQPGTDAKLFELPLETVARGNVRFRLQYELDEGLMQQMREEKRNMLMASVAGIGGGIEAGISGIGSGMAGGVGFVGTGIGTGLGAVESGIGVVGSGIGSGIGVVGSGLGAVGSGIGSAFKSFPGMKKKPSKENGSTAGAVATPGEPDASAKQMPSSSTSSNVKPEDVEVTIVGFDISANQSLPPFDVRVRALLDGHDKVFSSKTLRKTTAPAFNEHFKLKGSALTASSSIDFAPEWSLLPGELNLEPGKPVVYKLPINTLLDAARESRQVKLQLQDASEPAPELVLQLQPVASHARKSSITENIFGRFGRRKEQH